MGARQIYRLDRAKLLRTEKLAAARSSHMDVVDVEDQVVQNANQKWYR